MFFLIKEHVLIEIRFNLLLLFLHCFTSSFGQKVNTINWIQIGKEAFYCEIDAPQISILGDSKLTIVKINPAYADFELKSASLHNQNIPLPATIWADTFGYDLVVNAGMYDLLKPLTSKGFFKVGNLYNNKQINTSYNGIFIIDNHIVRLVDLKCDSTLNLTNYKECFQGMRMLDCMGNKMNWKKKKQSCSMLVASIDNQGNIYFIFSRSPYFHATFIDFLKELPLDLKTTIYLEGGPETSLYLRTPKGILEKVGSYVSNSYENDNNYSYWKLPNVIGVKFNGIN